MMWLTLDYVGSSGVTNEVTWRLNYLNKVGKVSQLWSEVMTLFDKMDKQVLLLSLTDVIVL